MATYFLNAAGSNTAPYDTPAKGAHDLTNLIKGVTEDSIIEVVEGTHAQPSITEDNNSVPYNIIIRSWGTNTTKPIIEYTISVGCPFKFTDLTSILVSGLIFKFYMNDSSASTSDGISLTGSSIIFERNELVGVDQRTTLTDTMGLLRVTGGITSISNNTFKSDPAVNGLLGMWGSAGSKIYNNTFKCNGVSDYAMYLRNACSLKNNIIMNATALLGAVQRRTTNPVITEDYNCFFNNVADLGSEMVKGVNSFTGDPLFISASNFQLQPGSPCIATGVGPQVDVNVPLTDILGVTRSGATTDIGAYQTNETTQAPVAGFSADSVSGRVPFTVTFTDSSTNTPTSWAWDFGDGTSSTIQNPSHVYNTPGIFTIGLTATNAGGSDGEIKIDYIIVVDKNPGDTKNPDDIVGMPGASDTSTGSNLRDTQLGTGPGNSGNTLEKNGSKKTQNRDDQFGSSEGARQRNNENTNSVKSLLPRIQELAQAISTFFYRIR
jgi:PKD repeat protein